MRRSSGGERAWFLSILAGENSRADESAYLTAFEIITEIEMLTNLCSTIDGGKEYGLL